MGEKERNNLASARGMNAGNSADHRTCLMSASCEASQYQPGDGVEAACASRKSRKIFPEVLKKVAISKCRASIKFKLHVRRYEAMVAKRRMKALCGGKAGWPGIEAKMAARRGIRPRDGEMGVKSISRNGMLGVVSVLFLVVALREYIRKRPMRQHGRSASASPVS